MPATPISAVWEHFQVFADKSSTCKVDNCDLRFNPPLRSTTAKRHLRRKHPKVYQAVIEKEVERKAGQKEDEERPFKSDSCETSYKCAWDLSKHKKRKQPQEGVDEDCVKMETVEFREDDVHDVEPAWIPTSSDRATTRKKPAVEYEKTLPVKNDPDALMADIVSIRAAF